ncbi:LCP family protein [Micromonospora sp. DR5-3]|uniref:LCP family protein n=1 Tax=unclassified Micromonospora TaxID=2617518 RepID=UPI0011DB9812|nr:MULTISPECIES: LCP family protein [unclassified Micromonospora]MCW3816541.1 LCP family protein [Micromonospora sp. DR5-3]TYC23109.1 LytR family transcriptional regulator [Micromonospora sp. MP36]
MPVQTSRRPPSLAPGAPGRVPPTIPTQPGPGGRGPRNSKKRTKRKDPLWARLTLIFGAVLMMTSGVAIVGSKAVIGQATSSIQQGSLLGDAGKSEAEGGKNLDGPIDMLLLGVDARASWAADDVRSDSIIILHIPASHDQAYLISIPRDTEAEIPGHGTDKINAAFQFGAQKGGGWEGGAQMMAKTIKKMTGISFDGAAIINFGGFKKVIDALGTVKICVSHEVTSKHMSYVNGKPMWNSDAEKLGKPMTPVVHKKGCREMKGWEALDFARQRYGLPRGDYDRQQNQQQLIKAMAKKASESGMLTNPIKLNQLIKAAGESLMLDTGGVKIEDFIFTLKGLSGNDLVTLRTNGGNFATAASGREMLNETSKQMFTAVKEDKLAEFVATNPEVLSTRK